MEPNLSDEQAQLHAMRKAKQNFLREEIVEQGYDPQVFTLFIDQKRGADIDLWTLLELQQIAQEFKLNYTSILEQLNSLSPSLHDLKENLPPTAAFSSKQNYEKYPILDTTPLKTRETSINSVLNPVEVLTSSLQPDSGDFPRSNSNSQSVDSIVEEEKTIEHSKLSVEEEAKCAPLKEKKYSSSTETKEAIDVYTKPAKLLPSTVLSESDKLQITVADHEIVHKGLLSSNYVVYKIVTKPMDWCVCRRYSDFTWLRDILSKLFPAHCMPPQPPKKTRGLLQSATLHKRQAYLQRFMDSIRRNPVFLRCEILVHFLRENNNRTFEKIQDKASKLHSPGRLADQLDIDGIVKCDSRPNSEYLQRMKEYFNNCETTQKKIKRASENVMQTMRAASDALHQYAEMVRQLAEFHSSIPMVSFTSESDKP